MIQWVGETLFATTVLMLLILAIRPFVADRFGARAAYLLWLAPALRMILPPLPADMFGDRAAAVQDVVVVLVGSSSPSLQSASATGGGTAWLILSLTIWLGGAVLFFGRHWLSYVQFSRNIVADGQALFAAGAIPGTASSAVSSPNALGVFVTSAVVPKDLAYRYDAAEQRLAVAHELTHHDRHDVPVNFAALAILALHWWNPVAHFAHRAFRLDQEAACDAIVLHGATPEERHAYGSALFKSAMGSVPLAACAMGATTTLKVRLRRIVSGNAEHRLAKPGAALVALLVLGGVAATASGSVKRAVDPAVEIPKALVLGGGMLNVSAPVEPAIHDERNCPDAQAHAAARARAKAMDIAEAERGEAEAARIEADQAVAEAREEAITAAAEARASAHEALIEAQMQLREAEAEAAIAMRGAEATRAAAVRSMKISCSNNNDGSVISIEGGEDASGRKQMQIMVCGDGARMGRAQIIEALRTTREQIAHDQMLPEQTRAHVLAALDRQIASVRPLPKPSLQ